MARIGKTIHVVFVAVLVVWISWFPQALHDRYYAVSQWVLLAAFSCVFVRRGVRMFHYFDGALLLFLAALSGNIFFAQDRSLAWATYQRLAVPLVCLYYVVSDGKYFRTYAAAIAATMCVASLGVSLLAVFEIVAGWNPIYRYVFPNPFYARYAGVWVRPMSTQFNPIVLGTYVVGCLPFCICFFQQQRTHWRRFIGAGAIVLNVVVAIMTFSRGALMGLVGIVFLYCIALKRYRELALACLGCICVFTVLSFAPYPLCRFSFGWILGSHGTGILSEYRLDRLHMVVAMLAQHPWWGIGLEHVRLLFDQYAFGALKGCGYEHKITDTMYLTILAETGIIGFSGMMCWIMVNLTVAATRFRSRAMSLCGSTVNGHRPSDDAVGLLAALAAYAAVLIIMNGYDMFYWRNQYLHFCVIAGCLGGWVRMDSRKETAKPCEKETDSF